jgi:hypothetical protein
VLRFALALALFAAASVAGVECPFCGSSTIAVEGESASHHVCSYCSGVVHAFADGRREASVRHEGARRSFPLVGARVVGCPAEIPTVLTRIVPRPGAVAVTPSHSVGAPAASIERPAPAIALPAPPVARPSPGVRPPSHPVRLPGLAVRRPAPPVARPAHPLARPAAPVAQPAAPVARPAPPGATLAATLRPPDPGQTCTPPDRR